MQESQKQWEELTVRDNYLFQLVMRNKRICKHLIEKILHITIKEIQYPQFEKNIAVSLGSKSIRMDVFVEDDTGKVYDIEMQCLNKGEEDLSLRASYYQSLLQIEMLEKGAAYTELHPSYVIFICTFDPYGAGLSQYTFKRCCLEKYSIQSKDRQLQIFLNSTQADKAKDPDIASFLQYIDGKAAEGVFARQIEQEVQNIKLQEKWRWEYMKWAMELKVAKIDARKEGLAEGRAEGRAEGQVKEKQESAYRLLKLGVDPQIVAEGTGLPLDEVRRIAETSK